MTCLEKLAEIHPEFTAQDMEEAIEGYCPIHFGIEMAPNNHCPGISCESCWGQEMEVCGHGQEHT